MTNLKFKKMNQSGYVALLTVIVLGVVVTVITTSIVLLGLGQERTSLSESQSVSAESAADACTEMALKQIRLVASYTGSGSLILSGSTCTYTVSNVTVASILVTGISGDSTHRVIVDLSSRTPNIVFTKWQEN
jgi:Tfp pilus assembly protein PilX